MTDEKIFICEYLNYVNSSDEPVGHGKKVLEESYALLKDSFNVVRVSSSQYSDGEGCCDESLIPLRYKELSNKELMNKQKENIKKAFEISGNDIIWVDNVEISLFVYLAFHKIDSRVILTVYRDIPKPTGGFVQFVKNKCKDIVKRLALKKVDLVIVTSPHIKFSKKDIHLPDYYYSNKYEKYKTVDKQDKVVCLGAMRPTKDLRGVVRHFYGKDVPVEIIGNFEDNSEYEFLIANKTDNMTIINRLLSDEEYYSLLAGSRFTILPYNMDAYATATSGILLESIFVGTIAIAPEQLLKSNDIQGIGYEKIEDIPSTMNELLNQANSVSNDIKKYDIELVKETLCKSIKQIERKRV